LRYNSNKGPESSDLACLQGPLGALFDKISNLCYLTFKDIKSDEWE